MAIKIIIFPDKETVPGRKYDILFGKLFLIPSGCSIIQAVNEWVSGIIFLVI